jgi:hypothetical protein
MSRQRLRVVVVMLVIGVALTWTSGQVQGQ